MYGKGELSNENIFEKALSEIVGNLFANNIDDNNSEITKLTALGKLKELIKEYGEKKETFEKTSIALQVADILEREVQKRFSEEDKGYQNFLLKSLKSIISSQNFENFPDNTVYLGIILSLADLFLSWPKVIFPEKELLNEVKLQVENYKIAEITPNYLKSEFDDERLKMYSSDNSIDVYIASIDSYYYIYKILGIKDSNAYFYLDLYDYFTKLYEKTGVENVKSLFTALDSLFKNKYKYSISEIESILKEEFEKIK